MIADILPSWVASADVWGDVPVRLYPREAAAVASAVEQRRREFATVRHCARTALGWLGHAPVPLVPRADRSPDWPAGVLGSMTHCAGYRAAAVARASDAAALGIDAEPHEPLPGELLRLVAVPAEVERLAALARIRPDVCWDRLTFSAKESVFKAWYPCMQRWLGFEDASLVFDPAAGTFVASLRQDLIVQGTVHRQLTGRWTVSRGLLATSVAVPVERHDRLPGGSAGRPAGTEAAPAAAVP